MNKSILTIPALLLTQLASAQSSVTIYGIIDQGITWSNSGTTPGSSLPGRGPANAVAVQQGNGSRLGFLGKEDLGGGLYSDFQMEIRYYPNTGALRGQLFYGRSWVGMGGDFGEFRLGRQYQPAYLVAINGDPTAWSYVSQLGSTYTMARYDQSTPADSSSVRWNNMITYQSPTYGGVHVELSSGLGEDGDRKPSKGGSIQYRSGPIYAGIAYDGLDRDRRMYVGVFSYDFGVVLPSVTYANSKGGVNGDGKAFSVAATVPVGVHRAWLSAGRYSPVGNAGASMMVGTGFEYNLSKRSALYINCATAKMNGRTRTVAVDSGIKHVF
jgi:predicted porin